MGFFKIDESSESTSFTEGMILALILVAASYVISYLAIHKLHWTFVSEAAVALLVGICAGGFLYAVDRTEGFQMSIFYDVRSICIYKSIDVVCVCVCVCVCVYVRHPHTPM